MVRHQQICCPRKKSRVIFLYPSSAVFSLVLMIATQIVTTTADSREFMESKIEAIGSKYCDFSSLERVYNIADLLQCMDELASIAMAHTRIGRSLQERGFPLPDSRRAPSYPPYSAMPYQYLMRPTSDYSNSYDRRPIKYYPTPPYYQRGQAGYYDGGFKYPRPSEHPYGFPGGSSAGLFDALASISRYDDLKCVPRILCEVATGVIPGSSDYKQNYDGGNSLISLLTALDIGESSPLLSFGKSALTGYTSRGNPSVCYREYPKCPRSNAELVSYLNNHNGGFFRFFGNGRGPSSQGNYYRGSLRKEPAPQLETSDPEADRVRTDEFKFDHSDDLTNQEYSGISFSERKERNDSDKVTFPQEPLQEGQSLNRVSKSLTGYEDSANVYQSPSFFPQEGKGQEFNMLYEPRWQRTMISPKSKLYLPDDPTNETISTFTFPDGQKVRINVAFSKLFSKTYKKALRRSFANDHSPQPVNFEGFSMVNLAELYLNDGTGQYIEIVHPCDMICHDSKGTPVQFNQILLHSGSLTTLMMPDQPILDLSNSVPCEVLCINRKGEKKQLSTMLHQVLRAGPEPQSASNTMGFQDYWNNRAYRSLNEQDSIYSHHRKVRENFKRLQRMIDESKKLRLPFVEQHADSEQLPDPGRYSESHSQANVQNPRRADEAKNEANVNTGGQAALLLHQPMFVGSGPMSFLSPPMPFMGMAGIPQGPVFLSGGSPSPVGLSMQPMQRMPIQPMQGMPMQPNNGIIQSLGMMPIFPGIIPMAGPLGRSGMLSMVPVSPPPTIVCSAPMCPQGPQSPQRILMMCGGILYFIPFKMMLSLPVCAMALETETNSGVREFDQTTTPTFSVTTQESTQRTFIPQALQVMTTTHKFRPPEGVDYPQQSCLEGESWSLEAHECVPIKYDEDIEADYTHLPGNPWSGVTKNPLRSHNLKKRKKLVIVTENGNTTYIKTT